MVDEAYSPVVISRKDAMDQGLKHYFTGVPCRNGHISRILISRNGCCACLSQQQTTRRLNNIEKYLERERSYEAKHKEKRLAKNRRYHKENKEKRNAESRRWYRENTEKALSASAEYMKMYRAQPNFKDDNRRRCLDYKARNPEKIKEITRDWNKNNSAKKKAYDRGREARKRGNGGTHTAEDIQDIFKQQRGKCAICAVSLKSISWHVDHVIPVVAGGSNDRRNLQILCAPCNLGKGGKDPIDAMRSLGRLL